jgi:beta-glucanase (GH16 family)
MMPYSSVYGGWPRSGEIDLAELRGNRVAMNYGTNVGINQTSSTLHFGPSPSCNGFMKTFKAKNSPVGFNENFNTYKVIWTSTNMTFYVNDDLYGTVNPSEKIELQLFEFFDQFFFSKRILGFRKLQLLWNQPMD